MNEWADANTQPHGMLYPDGIAAILGATGKGKGQNFLWYWQAGTQQFRVVKGGTITPAGELRDKDGETIAWISPIEDMPQFPDKVEAEHLWREARKEAAGESFMDWLQGQAATYGPLE